MIGLWTIGRFDDNLIQMDDYPTDSCAISPKTFLFLEVLFTIKFDSHVRFPMIGNL